MADNTMKPQQLFPALLFLVMTLLAMPGHAQMAAGPMNRVVRPDTPANQRLLTAIEAGDLPGVKAALQVGASADAEAGWKVPDMDVPPSPAQPFGNPTSFTVLATDSLLRGHDNTLAIFRLLLHNEPASSFTDPKKAVVLMYSAVDMSDLESVRWLAARGVGINPPYPSIGSILSASLAREDTRVKTLSPLTAFLLEHGAQLNIQDLEGGTPLMTAAEYGKVDVVRALLAHGADPALRDKRGWTALDWAARMGYDDVIPLLRNRSPMNIYEAAQFGNLPRLRASLDAGMDPNTVDAAGMTPLMNAAQSGSLATARLLLDRGAAVDQKQPDGTTALHLAALHGNALLASLLLDRGADANAVVSKWRSLFTPLNYAVEQVQADTVALLLRRGADLSHGQGEAALDTTLSHAGEAFRPSLRHSPTNWRRSDERVLDARHQIIDLLLAAGVDLRAQNSHALFLAATGGQAGIVNEFLNKGANVNGRGAVGSAGIPSDGSGETALMGAVEAWSSAYNEEVMLEDGTESGRSLQDVRQAEQYAAQSVMLLLRRGGDVNLPDAWGTTPLMLCVNDDLPTLAEILLAHGASIDGVNPTGQTALMLAASNGSTKMAALLLRHHAGINKRDKEGRTPLMLAVDDGSNDDLRSRLARNDKAFADNPAYKPRPVPPKDFPNQDGHPGTVRLLLRHGAAVNAVARNGATALSLARKENFGPVAVLLTQAGARR